MATPIPQQHKVNSAASGTSIAATFDATPAVNALIVVLIGVSHTAQTTDPGALSVSDNQGNSYADRTTQVLSNGMRSAVFTAPAATASGTFTVTANWTNSNPCSIHIIEVRGHNAGALQRSGSTYGYSDSSAFPRSPLNLADTTTNEQLALGVLFSGASYNRNYGPDTGWTQLDEIGSSTTVPNFCTIYKDVATAGVCDPSWTMAGGGGTVQHYHGITIQPGTDGIPGGGLNLAQSGAIALAGSLAVLGNVAGVGQFWRVPTNIPNGTSVHMMVFSGSSPTYAILAQGVTVVAGGYASIPATTGNPDDKGFAFVHNYNDNTATAAINGGPGIGTRAAV